MRKPFFLLLFILLSTLVYGQRFQDTIPFRSDLGLIIIPISFNGVEKQFAFDTGAQATVAFGWAKESLKKTKKNTIIKSSSGLKSKMRYYKSGKIKLGSRKITGHKILNTPRNEIFTCYQVDGVLGIDIIKNMNWSIDYEKKILIMYPSNYVPKKVKKMSKLDFEFNANKPYVSLHRKQQKFRFLLDTGAGGTSNISKRNYKLVNLKEYPQISFYSGGFDVNGILTPEEPIFFKFPASTSDEVSLSPIVKYNNRKSTKIANQLWQGKTLFMSLKKQLLFVSDAVVDETYSGYSCSVMFQKGKMRISSIQVGSKLWNMGIRKGDEVLSYNGKSFTDFCSLDQFKRELAKTTNSFELELANGKKITISKQIGI